MGNASIIMLNAHQTKIERDLLEEVCNKIIHHSTNLGNASMLSVQHAKNEKSSSSGKLVCCDRLIYILLNSHQSVVRYTHTFMRNVTDQCILNSNNYTIATIKKKTCFFGWLHHVKNQYKHSPSCLSWWTLMSPFNSFQAIAPYMG
jgi:hypothetical protein